MDFKNEVFAPCTSIFEAAVTISRRSSLNDALSSYLEALKLSPRLADATRGIAIVYERQASPLIDAGKYAEALRLLKQSLNIYPENYVFHFQLGRTYSLLKQEESALQAFNHALKLKPDFALAHYAKGLTLVGLDRFEAALDEASALKPLDEKLGNDLFDFVSKTVLNIKLAVLRQELEAQGTFSNPVQVSSGSMTEMIFFIPTSFASCDVSWRQSTATIAMNYSSAALAALLYRFRIES